jgi:dTMP kinase
MKVYFGSAITYGRKYLENTQLIVDNIESLGHKVISKYVVDPKLRVGDGLGPKALFKRETKTIEKADIMVAEVTQPSWGTAFLIEHALEHRKPVLALFYKDNGKDLPLMIDGHPELYKEYYDEHNIKPIVKKFFKFVQEKGIKQKGRLLVIDGSDGSGKATQAKKLVDYLKKNKFKHKYIDFPRYYTSFHGKMVGRFLKGDFGSLSQVDPHLVSYTYALDRLAAKDELLDWLNDGNMVVANRYTTSSMAFQAARVPKTKRKAFVNWLYELEYKQNRLPKEDIVIFLYVPAEVSQKLLDKKAGAKSRRYTGGKKKDINETNVDYQKEVINMYLQLAKQYRHWHIIDCVDKKGNILSREEIHQKVIDTLEKKKLI